MQMKPTIFVLREDRNANALWIFLKNNWRAMAQQGKPLVINISTEKEKRSVEQNKYHWQMLGQVSEQAWLNGRQYSPEIWHRFFCGEFLGKEELPNGEMTYISSTTLSVPEFADFDRRIEAYSTQNLGVQFVEIC
jgi:hypothetical protein